MSKNDVETTSLPAAPQYRTYLDVFLGDRYRKCRLLPPMSEEESLAYQRIQATQRFFQEGCLPKALIMGGGGGVLGLLFGTFFFSMRHTQVDTTLLLREQVRQAYKDFVPEVTRSAKGFAKLGFMYSLFDCVIARVTYTVVHYGQTRARQDLSTALYAGCLTGAALAWKGGPVSMATGCAGFGAFSALMEKWNPLAPREEGVRSHSGIIP